MATTFKPFFASYCKLKEHMLSADWSKINVSLCDYTINQQSIDSIAYQKVSTTELGLYTNVKGKTFSFHTLDNSKAVKGEIKETCKRLDTYINENKELFKAFLNDVCLVRKTNSMTLYMNFTIRDSNIIGQCKLYSTVDEFMLEDGISRIMTIDFVKNQLFGSDTETNIFMVDMIYPATQSESIFIGEPIEIDDSLPDAVKRCTEEYNKHIEKYDLSKLLIKEEFSYPVDTRNTQTICVAPSDMEETSSGISPSKDFYYDENMDSVSVAFDKINKTSKYETSESYLLFISKSLVGISKRNREFVKKLCKSEEENLDKIGKQLSRIKLSGESSHSADLIGLLQQEMSEIRSKINTLNTITNYE